MTQPEALKALEGMVEQAVRAHQFSGTVLIARQGSPIFLVELDLRSGYAIIVLSNCAPPAATDGGSTIRRPLGAVTSKTG